mmetsp:Transcript_32282/g.56673  ORF Transcript_32282/g.56673 Transcript_32282/m.56673 type:complete len:221 (-) Transcript_32282:880-1542(-)
MRSVMSVAPFVGTIDLTFTLQESSAGATVSRMSLDIPAERVLYSSEPGSRVAGVTSLASLSVISLLLMLSDLKYPKSRYLVTCPCFRVLELSLSCPIIVNTRDNNPASPTARDWIGGFAVSVDSVFRLLLFNFSLLTSDDNAPALCNLSVGGDAPPLCSLKAKWMMEVLSLGWETISLRLSCQLGHFRRWTSESLNSTTCWNESLSFFSRSWNPCLSFTK